MLLGVDRHESLVEQLRGQRTVGIVLGVGIVLELIFAIRAGIGFSAKAPATFDAVANKGGNAAALSRVLFRQYFFPFEVTSILLIVAAIAVMVLASSRGERGALGAPDAAIATPALTPDVRTTEPDVAPVEPAEPEPVR
jgi:NADH-quinone oxidoreductase subunit J